MPGQINPQAPLPEDPALRTGVLDNGMTWYVRENDEPEERAFLNLVVNVGSLQAASSRDIKRLNLPGDVRTADVSEPNDIMPLLKARIAGKGTVGFSDCTFMQWDRDKEGRAAIQVESGTVLVRGCEQLGFVTTRIATESERPVVP